MGADLVAVLVLDGVDVLVLHAMGRDQGWVARVRSHVLLRRLMRHEPPSFRRTTSMSDTDSNSRIFLGFNLVPITQVKEILPIITLSGLFAVSEEVPGEKLANMRRVRASANNLH